VTPWEDEADYWRLYQWIEEAARPNDALEHIWTKNFVDAEWEMRRLTKAKVQALKAHRKSALLSLLPPPSIFEDNSDFARWRDALADRFVSGDAQALRDVATQLRSIRRSITDVDAYVYTLAMDDVRKLEALIAFNLHRRDSAINSIQKRRDGFARRVTLAVRLLNDDLVPASG